jgi:predicted nucleic acid-binding protein
MARLSVMSLDQSTVEKAASVAVQYQLSHWDALIVASALLADCDNLYSEDLQHGQIFEDKLTVLNPFLPA